MPQPKEQTATSQDYWSLPENCRGELIDGRLVMMAPPGRIHQELAFALSRQIADFLDARGYPCKLYPAPFAVNLEADDTTWVEPDISVICDSSKLSDRGCEGAPDFIVEVVSPTSRRMDYNIKTGKYALAGVREYWIVDPLKKRTTMYHFEEDAAPVIFPFEHPLESGLYKGLQITLQDLL